MVRGWVVEGEVQGVGFRWFVQLKARDLGLAGWVRNLPDASVEVMANGSPEDLDILEGILRRGPPAADVHQLRRVEAPAEVGQARQFEVRR